MYLCKKLFEETVLRHVHQLKKIGTESVPVLFKEGPGVVEDHPCEVIEPKAGVDVRLWLQVVPVVSVPLVKFVQHGLITTLNKT